MTVADALSAENRRLRAEVRRLDARLRAIEASRWWRLNPRETLRRRSTEAAGDAHTSQALVRVPRNGPAVGPRDLRGSFSSAIVPHGRFTRLWGLDNAEPWEEMLASLDGEHARVLEVGAFEGLTSCYLLWRLPDASLTCVDTFAGGLDHAGTGTVPDDLEAIFDANVALVDAGRVRKVVGESVRTLPSLLASGETFDFVYLDGSHLGLDVLVDASMAWQMLRVGGYLVFDDYLWAELGSDALLRPGPAIDAFLGLLEGKYERVLDGEQIAVRKLA